MQKRKNFKLLILLILVMAANAALIFLKPKQNAGFNDRYKYTLTDTAGINQIQLKGDNLVDIQKTFDGWKINDKYDADPNMIGLLMAVMTSVEATRQVSDQQNATIDQENDKKVKVTISKSGQEVISFLASGNSTKTASYFSDIESDRSYVVSIPGYSSYVAGIFDLTESDWREKQVFNTSWSSLKSLELYRVGDSSPLLDVNYFNNFFKIEGVKQVDTAMMMDYLQSTTELKVEQYISAGDFTEYDSLANTIPVFDLQIVDANEENNGHLEIFATIPENHRRLVKIYPSEELALVREQSIRAIFKNPGDFSFKK